jgi:ankyrin repeat protein
MSDQDSEQLMAACDFGNFAGVRALVSGGASVNFHQCGFTPAIHCCRQGHTEILKFLLENGANADLATNDGYTPLHWAAFRNTPECVTLLVAHGAALNAVDKYGRTALWCASHQGYRSVAELLVQSGADIDIADNDGKTAIVIAAKNGHAALATYLDNQSKRRRRGPLAKVRTSIKDVENSDARVMKVLQNDDLMREIRTYL